MSEETRLKYLFRLLNVVSMDLNNPLTASTLKEITRVLGVS